MAQHDLIISPEDVRMEIEVIEDDLEISSNPVDES